MRRLAVGFAAFVALSLAALYPFAGFDGGSAGADLTVCFGYEPESLDPLQVTGLLESRTLDALFEGLMRLDPKTQDPVPGMAERVEVSPDALTYTFHLRDARWSDGSPVTAGDFAWSWRRILDPASGCEYVYMLYPLRNAQAFNEGKVSAFGEVGVEALDAGTLRVTLDRPTPYFLNLTAFMTLLPVQRRCVEEHGDLWIKPGRIVTNGPYRLAEWKPYVRLTLAKNPDYWDAGSVRLGRIACLSVQDEIARLNFYETGDCDWFMDPPLLLIDALKRRSDYRADPAFRTQYVLFNVAGKPVLRDPRVRKALGQAIDRKAITERVTKAGEIPRDGFVPGGLPGYSSPPGLPHDPAAARRLLAEAGFPGARDFPTGLRLLTSTSPDAKRIGEVIQQMWKETLGVRIGLDAVERKMWFEAMRRLEYDITVMGWMGDYRDPMTFLDMYVTGGGNNRAAWTNPRYDELIGRAAREPDPVRRRAFFREAESILIEEEVPIVPLYQAVSLSLQRPWVRGVWPNIQGIHPLREVWVEP